MALSISVSFVSVSVTNTLTKSNVGKKGIIWLTIPGCSVFLQEARQELRAVGHIRGPTETG